MFFTVISVLDAVDGFDESESLSLSIKLRDLFKLLATFSDSSKPEFFLFLVTLSLGIALSVIRESSLAAVSSLDFPEVAQCLFLLKLNIFPDLMNLLVSSSSEKNIFIIF